MWNFHGPLRKCRGTLSRRDVLQVGALSLAGLTLADVLKFQAAAVQESKNRPNKSVIMIWLRGGASHIDSFDMKPEAPAEIRGELRPIATSVPGLQFGELCPNLAREAHRLWPNAQHHVMPATDHLLMLEDPQAFNRLVLEFIDGVEQQLAGRAGWWTRKAYPD